MDESWLQIGNDAAGKTVVIGSPGNGDNGDGSGHVRVFTLSDDSEWQQLGNNIKGDAELDFLGSSVSLMTTQSQDGWADTRQSCYHDGGQQRDDC